IPDSILLSRRLIHFGSSGFVGLASLRSQVVCRAMSLFIDHFMPVHDTRTECGKNAQAWSVVSYIRLIVPLTGLLRNDKVQAQPAIGTTSVDGRSPQDVALALRSAHEKNCLKRPADRVCHRAGRFADFYEGHRR